MQIGIDHDGKCTEWSCHERKGEIDDEDIDRRS